MSRTILEVSDKNGNHIARQAYSSIADAAIIAIVETCNDKIVSLYTTESDSLKLFDTRYSHTVN